MNFLQKFDISKDVFKRFPLVLVFGVLATIVGLILNHKYSYPFSYFDTEPLEKIFYFSISSMVLSIALPLFFEAKKLSIVAQIIIYFVFFVLVGINVYYCNLYSSVFLGLALFLSLTIAKFLFKSSSNESFLFFNNKLLKAFLYGYIVVPLILSIGAVLIAVSITYLFDSKVLYNILDDLSFILYLTILPVFLISHIPKQIDYKLNSLEFGKFSSVLIQYVLVGLLSVYLVVLYIYFAKIIIFFELPKGGLSWMILIFSSFVIMVKIFLLGVRNKHKLALLFDKYAFAFLAIPIVFLDIAIFRRIYEYGLTEFRIILVFIDIWLSLVVVFYLLNKKLHFKYIFISLFIGFFILSQPFINLEKIAANSQVERFKKILIDNKILQNGKIVYQKNIPDKARAQIDDLSKYLVDNSYAIAKLKNIISNDISSSEDLITTIKVQSLKKEQNFKIFSSINSTVANSVKGYDYFYGYATASSHSYTLIQYANDKEVKFDTKGMSAFLHFDNAQTMSYNLAFVIKTLKENNVTKIDKDTIKFTTITKENKNIRVKLQILKLITKKVDNNSSIDDIMANIYLKELK